MGTTQRSGRRGSKGGSEQPSTGNDGGGGPRWGRFAFVVLDVVLVIVIGFFWYLLFFLWQWHQATDEGAAPSDPVPVFSGALDGTAVPEARARSLGMLMEIYDALSREAGVGDWQPGTVWQVSESRLDCGSNGAEEVYELADAAPYVDEEQALAVVEQVAAGYGFEHGSGLAHVHADLVRAADQATITLYGRRGAKELTSLKVSSGCHRGSYLQDWPTGTEVVPGYLRDGGPVASPRVWADQTPAVPTPSQGWPAPTYTPVPTGPRSSSSPTTRQS